MATKKKIELKDSGVIFNAEDHTYLLGDKYLSGITPVLQRQFFPTEFEVFQSTSSIRQRNTERRFTSHARTSTIRGSMMAQWKCKITSKFARIIISLTRHPSTP